MVAGIDRLAGYRAALHEEGRRPIVATGLSLVAGEEIEPVVTLPTELVIRESA
jgi:hypothetical protein